MIALLKAIPALLSAAVSVKNLKSKSTATGVGVGAVGAVAASQALPPDSTEAIITNFVCAAVALYGLFKGCRDC